MQCNPARFDFHHTKPVAAEELAEVETLVKRWVFEQHPVKTNVMDLDAAKSAGALSMAGEKYDSVVRVVDVPGVSKELCGGMA